MMKRDCVYSVYKYNNKIQKWWWCNATVSINGLESMIHYQLRIESSKIDFELRSRITHPIRRETTALAITQRNGFYCASEKTDNYLHIYCQKSHSTINYLLYYEKPNCVIYVQNNNKLQAFKLCNVTGSTIFCNDVKLFATDRNLSKLR